MVLLRTEYRQSNKPTVQPCNTKRISTSRAISTSGTLEQGVRISARQPCSVTQPEDWGCLHHRRTYKGTCRPNRPRDIERVQNRRARTFLQTCLFPALHPVLSSSLQAAIVTTLLPTLQISGICCTCVVSSAPPAPALTPSLLIDIHMGCRSHSCHMMLLSLCRLFVPDQKSLLPPSQLPFGACVFLL